jgi:hypothetical protein
MEITPEFLEDLWNNFKDLIPSKQRTEVCYLMLKTFFDHNLLDHLTKESLFGIDKHMNLAVENIFPEEDSIFDEKFSEE